MKRSASRLLSTLLVLCMVLSLLPGAALAADTSGKCGDNLTWTYGNGTLTISGTGNMDDYFLSPNEVESGPSVLPPWWDYRDEIQTLVINEGVTNVGKYAFSMCMALTSVTIPESVTDFKFRAFSFCDGLTSVTIPGNVTNIGDCAFMYCVNLTSVTISDGVTTIGDNAFASCESLTNVTIPGSVTSIGYAAFGYCLDLTSVAIPDSVTSIEEFLFVGCTSLKSVTIPVSVTSVGRQAFQQCNSLTDVYYSGSKEQWDAIAIDDSYDENAPLHNATKHYNSTGPDVPDTPKAVLSPQKLKVNGEEKNCEKYNINDENYFKLRDLAYMLGGTGSKFSVDYDYDSQLITIKTGQSYTPIGTELDDIADRSETAVVSIQEIFIDGEKVSLTAYNIGGFNYFRLRDLGPILNFEVDFDRDTNTAIIKSK